MEEAQLDEDINISENGDTEVASENDNSDKPLDDNEDESLLKFSKDEFEITNEDDMRASGEGFDHYSGQEDNAKRPTSAPDSNKPTQKSEEEKRPFTAAPKKEINRTRNPSYFFRQAKPEEFRRIKEREARLANEEKKREKERAEDKRKENEEYFQSWIKRKQNQTAEQRRKEKENESPKKEEVSKDEKESFFKDWLKTKREQTRKEAQLRQKEREECERESTPRSKDECNQAFKSWIRRKKRDAVQKQQIEVERARITRRAMRQCRKSQVLANEMDRAIARSSKFIDP